LPGVRLSTSNLPSESVDAVARRVTVAGGGAVEVGADERVSAAAGARTTVRRPATRTTPPVTGAGSSAAVTAEAGGAA